MKQVAAVSAGLLPAILVMIGMFFATRQKTRIAFAFCGAGFAVFVILTIFLEFQGPR